MKKVGILVALCILANVVFAANKDIRDKIVEIASKQKGQKYEMNNFGSWPPGFDCSGLVSYSYFQAGVNGFGSVSPNTHGPNTDILVTMSNPVTSDGEIYPGDLIFQHYTYDKHKDGKKENDLYTHVGIYVGGGKLINAGDPVQFENLKDWKNKNNFAGTRRIKTEYWPNGDSGYRTDSNVQEGIVDKISNLSETTEKNITKTLDKKADEASKNLEKQMEKKVSSCCMAEAAYASSANDDLYVLRDFRDDVLKENNAGRWFVSEYYKNSPPIAKYLAKNETARYFVREVIVEPAVATIKIFSNDDNHKSVLINGTDNVCEL